MFDQDQAAVFLRKLWEWPIKAGHLLVWSRRQKVSKWGADLLTVMGHIERLAADDDVYVGCGLREQVLGAKRRGGSSDVVCLPGFWADIDIAHEVHAKKHLPRDTNEAMALAERIAPPSVVLHSGHGLQCWWLFLQAVHRDEAPIAAMARYWGEKLQASAAAMGLVIDSTHDLSRVLRVPGTYNRKNGACVPVELLQADGPRHAWQDLYRQRGKGTQQQRHQRPQIHHEGLSIDVEPPADRMMALACNDRKFRASWERQRPDLSSQSEYDLSMASIAARAGWSDQEMAALILAHRRKHDENPAKALRPDYMARTIALARETPPDGRSVALAITQGQYEQAAEDGEDAARSFIEAQTGVWVSRFVQRGKERGKALLYVEVRGHSGEILIGKAEDITQMSFRRAIRRATAQRIVAKKVRAETWDLIDELIGQLTVFEPIDETDLATTWQGIIDEHWQHHYHEERDPMEQARNYRPIIKDGQRALSTRGLLAHAETMPGIGKVDRVEMLATLRAMGWQPVTVAAAGRTSRHYYRENPALPLKEQNRSKKKAKTRNTTKSLNH